MGVCELMCVLPMWKSAAEGRKRVCLDPCRKPAFLNVLDQEKPLPRYSTETTRVRAKLLISLQTAGVGRNFRGLAKSPPFVEKENEAQK